MRGWGALRQTESVPEMAAVGRGRMRTEVEKVSETHPTSVVTTYLTV